MIILKAVRDGCEDLEMGTYSSWEEAGAEVEYLDSENEWPEGWDAVGICSETGETKVYTDDWENLK